MQIVGMAGTIWNILVRCWRGIGHALTFKEVAIILGYWATIAGWLSLAAGFVVAVLLEYKFLGAIACGVGVSLLVAICGWLRNSGAVKVVSATLEPPNYTTREPYPNLSIQELFEHLDPNALDGDWEQLGRLVLNELSVGVRLRAWGLKYAGSLEATERDSREVLIPTDYWDGADFTYLFFADDHKFAPHTYPRSHSNLTEYANVRVNKEQVIAIWPRAIRTSISDVQIKFVDFAKIAAQQFGWEFAPGNFAHFEFLDGARHAANDGDLYMRGKKGCNGMSEAGRDIPLLEPIEPKEWRERDLRIWSYSTLDTALPDTDNWDVRVGSVDERNEAYRDIYITSKKAAVTWLERVGPEWKGRKEKRYWEREKERAARDNADGNEKTGGL